MNPLPKIITAVDAFQRQHAVVGFPYAVIKKYGDDEAGNQAALLTYYGFLALFPLLLVVTTLVSIFAAKDSVLQQAVLTSLSDYFPLLGSQLAGHIQTIHKSGWPLIIGIIFTLYGARGVADAFRNGVNHVWNVPKNKRTGFPASILHSLALMLVGGFGFLLASISSGYAAAAGRGFLFKGLALLLNTVILYLVFMFLYKISLARQVARRHLRVGAVTAAIGIAFLQSVGSLVLAQQLKGLDALYSYFAIALGLLFWIYLQAQVVYYAIEIANVRAEGLWPRGLRSDNKTKADLKLLKQDRVDS